MVCVSSEVLHYEDVKFRRDGREILKRRRLARRKKAKNWALLGLNGAGKSTMLSMIPAYQIPTTGLLRVFGHEFGKYAWVKIKNRLGFVSATLGQFQSTLDRQLVENVVISGAFNTIGVYKDVSEDQRKKSDRPNGRI